MMHRESLGAPREVVPRRSRLLSPYRFARPRLFLEAPKNAANSRLSKEVETKGAGGPTAHARSYSFYFLYSEYYIEAVEDHGRIP